MSQMIWDCLGLDHGKRNIPYFSCPASIVDIFLDTYTVIHGDSIKSDPLGNHCETLPVTDGILWDFIQLFISSYTSHTITYSLAF
jgi:hypothetical protein